MGTSKVGAGDTARSYGANAFTVRTARRLAIGIPLLLAAGGVWALQFGVSGNGYTRQATCAAVQEQATKGAQQRCKPQGVLRMKTSTCKPRSTAYVTQRESYTAQVQVTVECGKAPGSSGAAGARSGTSGSGNPGGKPGVHNFVATGDNPNSGIDACQGAVRNARQQATAHCARRGGIEDWKTAKCETTQQGGASSRYKLYTSRVRTAVRCRQ